MSELDNYFKNNIEGADFWYREGVNPIPFDTKNKKPILHSHKEYLDTCLSESKFNEWKGQGKFEKGFYIVCGKVRRGKNAGLYLIVIDIDEELGIIEFCKRNGKETTLQELSNITLIDQHKDNLKKAHIYFYSPFPFPSKGADSILGMEIKGERLLIAPAPTIHHEGSPREIIGNKKEPIVLTYEQAIELLRHIDEICSRHGLKYIKKSSSKISAKIRTMIKSLAINHEIIINQGERNHTLLYIADSLLFNHHYYYYSKLRGTKKKKNKKKGIDELRDFFFEINNKLCKPEPLPQQEIEKIWKSALDYTERVSNQEKEEHLQEEKNDEGGDKQESKSVTTFKYSQMGKGDLYESVFVDGGIPVFIKYNEEIKEFEKIKEIKETTRLLVSPTIEECPYMPYEFESLDEINRYSSNIENNKIDLDYLYSKSLEFISKYNNQSKHNLRVVAINLVSSYFQDRFSTTHYLYPVGGNGSGKSSLADTFKAGAYRAVTMTDPTAPNLFRLLGVVEPAQCVIILEEADKIDKSPELLAVLKTGYALDGRVPKINPYTLKQEFFYSYCLKVIVSERSLNQSIAKGVNSRTFPINCFKGVAKHDIKEVLNPTNTGGQKNKKLLKEILDFRKLLLVYRLRHFKDPIPDIDIGVQGRDKELVKHLVQLFYGCKCLKTEIIETLQKFLDIKNEKKNSSIESILLPIISTLVKFNGSEISSKTIWDELKKEIPGQLDGNKPNEYHTNDYGTIYRTTISNIICDSFGAIVKHRKEGNVLIFDREIIEKLVIKDEIRITIKEPIKSSNQQQQEKEEQQTGKKKVESESESQEGEGVKTVNTPERGVYPKTEETTETRNTKEEEEEGRKEAEGEAGNVEGKRLVKKDNNNGGIIAEEQQEQVKISNIPPSSNAFNPFIPSSTNDSHISNNHREKEDDYQHSITKTLDLEELKTSISSFLYYEDVLSVLEKEKNPQTRDLIIYNAKNIKRISSHSDKFVCSLPCRYSQDKWFMLKHPCKNFYKEKKGKENKLRRQ